MLHKLLLLAGSLLRQMVSYGLGILALFGAAFSCVVAIATFLQNDRGVAALALGAMVASLALLVGASRIGGGQSGSSLW